MGTRFLWWGDRNILNLVCSELQKSMNLLTLASLVAQLIKNSPAMQETPVRFLGWKDPMEKG